MLYYTMLCYAKLRYTILCYAILCCTMLCYALLCYAMLYYSVLYYAMPCYAILVLCFALLRDAILCYTTLFPFLLQQSGSKVNLLRRRSSAVLPDVGSTSYSRVDLAHPKPSLPPLVSRKIEPSPAPNSGENGGDSMV